jgi:dihydropteroate synthase
MADIQSELDRSLRNALDIGIDQHAIVLDPGIGFAKRSEHSLRVLAELERLMSLGCPIMVGVSRKRFIGELSGVVTAHERVAGTVGANVAALLHGARLFRVHDVAPNRQALDVAWGVLQANQTCATPRSDSPVADGSPFPVPGSRRP